jgi:predicted O-linked N-acetylglucosamine transferase (SPINDLY family)
VGLSRKHRRAAAKFGRRLDDGRANTRSPVGISLAELWAASIAHHREGRWKQAETSYRDILALKPDLAEALSNLGIVLQQQGKLDEAISTYREAIGIKPSFPEAHSNLGNALQDQGRLDEAAVAHREAIRLKPDYAKAHSNLGNVLRAQGKLDEAAAAHREAIRITPDFAEAHSNLGGVFKDQGKLDDAATAYRRAIGAAPSYAVAHYNLGTVLLEQGKLEEAVAAFSAAIRIKPDYAEAHSNLAVALNEQGKLDEALAACRQAIRLKLDDAEPHSNLGNVLKDLGRLDEALAAHREALEIKPTNAKAYSNLGLVLQEQGKLDDALAAFRTAIRVNQKHSDAHSNLLFGLNYHDALTPDQVFAAHREWAEHHGWNNTVPPVHVNRPDMGRRLKIGYVSPDFRGHSVACFVQPLLKFHDRQAVEVFCYAEVKRLDGVTTHLRQLADHWLLTVGLSDDELAERIRADGIDILVDLAGHTANNRLGVFARKPAPVQVTWLGYPNTTGLKAIDYRLVDAVTDPVGQADSRASETLVRIPDGFLCYAPWPDLSPFENRGKEASEPTIPPSLKTGIVTFGSFNNPTKISPATLDAWATLLSRLRAARLLLKGKPFVDATTRQLFLDRFSERGVAANRVTLAAFEPRTTAHLAFYNQVDIALDPFPYNGTTTTCEALWMGVPVIALSGDRHAGRVGASLLGQVGLADLLAESVEEYVEIACSLAADQRRLEDLRRTLRPRMAASPLCDGAAFSRKMEAIFRMMWKRWCESSARV